MNKRKDYYSFNFIDVIIFLNKWKKHLLVVSVLSAIIASIVSSPLFITPKYKSKALFYPSTTNSISSSLFYTIKQKSQDPLMFGDEEVDEQYMQLLASGTLKSKVMTHFDLMNHYKIDPNRVDKYTALDKKYEDNVSVKRTNYNSIEIEVFDEDPKVAADIANGIMYYVDTVKSEIQGRLAKQIFTIVEEQYNAKKLHIDSLKSKMKLLGIKGVYLGIKGVYGTPQSKVSENSAGNNISENSAEYIALEEELKFEVEHLADLHLKYEQAKVDMAAKLSNIFVVSYAIPSETRSYPIRSIIVLVSVLSAFVMSCVVLLTIEKYHQFKNKIS